MNYKKYDVVIVGAGIMGLFLAKKLLTIGLSVIILEKGSELANGPSTKNEGILHRGTYHSYAIDDVGESIEVARKCIYGYDQILAQYPEVFEEFFLETIAIIKDKKNYLKAINRWDKAGVLYKNITYERAKKILPEVKISEEFLYFKIKEKAINTRLLLHTILKQIGSFDNIKILRGVHQIKFIDKFKISATYGDGDGVENINFDYIVYSSGKGTKKIFKEEFNIELPIRVFKALLLVTKRLSKNNVYFLDEREVSIFQHGDKSIIGETKYNKPCLNDEDYEIDDDLKHSLINKVKEYFDFDDKNAMIFCSHKVDYGGENDFHSLDSKLNEPFNNHFIAMPGKMTEAPWLADYIMREIFKRKNDSIISERPCDKFTPDQNISLLN